MTNGTSQSLNEKLFNNPAGFAIFHIVLAIPTYIIPYIKPGAVSKAAAALSMDQNFSNGIGFASTFWTVVQIALYAGLFYGSLQRGKYVNKGYLKAFPIAAAVFDLAPVLNWIPFVPSIMHILSLAMGIPEGQKQNSAQTTTQKAA